MNMPFLNVPLWLLSTFRGIRNSSSNLGCKGPSIINTAFCKRSHCCPKSRLWKWCHYLHCWLLTSSLTRLAFFVPILHLLSTIYDPVSISHLSQHVIEPRMSATVVDICNNQLGDVVFLWQDHGVCCIIR